MIKDKERIQKLKKLRENAGLSLKDVTDETVKIHRPVSFNSVQKT